jgi:4a-hydroxytetrahydrobiopterin dehydratase
MPNDSTLACKACTPCRGGIPPLTRDEAEAHHRQTPDWILLDDASRIERRFTFKNFVEAFAFVQQASDLGAGEHAVTWVGSVEFVPWSAG